LILSNNSTKPDKILKARLNAAKRCFLAVCTNCRIMGITNVKVKLLLVNALVRSVLLYGGILYACMSDVITTLTPSNALFAQVEIFYRKMLRWIFQQKYDTRRSLLYVISN
jgi:ABC-type Co2+ transport system permease subunit